MKLTEEDAYFTMFEWLMVVYEMKKEHWAFRLAPQLVGKAQQAYAGMSVADMPSGDYKKLKAVNLWRYDITEESYLQQFRSAKLNPGESVTELLARIEDFAGK